MPTGVKPVGYDTNQTRQLIVGETPSAPAVTGDPGLPDLANLVRTCGFDEVAYLQQNPDLQRAGFDPSQAFDHFLAHGYTEERNVACGSLPDGLTAIHALAATDRDRAKRLFRSLFFDPERYDLLRVRMGGWTEFYAVMFPMHQEQHQRRQYFTP